MREPHTSSFKSGIPENESIRVLNLYQTAEKIYTRRLKGHYQNLRRWTWIPLLSAYFLVPWFTVNNRQMVLFDLVERKFHVFWITFWPQDFALLAWLLIIAAFALFTLTNLLGRIWCGFSCPQTVWTQIFMFIEELFEGNRSQRIKLDLQPWTSDKLWRKSGKQLVWGAISLATGLTFVGYFNPIRELLPSLLMFEAHSSVVFWVLFFTAATWANAGFMREQVCLYMCPYARFQSAVFDSDTLIVSYNPQRGEPRGKRRRDQTPAEIGLGDCVDCTLCVQVCPTGIDIRDGLQYQCINCGMCVDACNSVMRKLNYKSGLISFTTENWLKRGAQFRFLRPRFVAYLTVLIILVAVFTYTIASRIPLEIDVIRDRSMLYRITEGGLIENIYQLKINNMDQAGHEYSISIDSQYPLQYEGQSEVRVAGGETVELLVRLKLAEFESGGLSMLVDFIVSANDAANIKEKEISRFLVPAHE